MPEFNKGSLLSVPAADYTATTTELKHGDELFNRYCATCHVVNEGGGGLAPDLAYSTLSVNPASFKAIVHEGGYLRLGMPRFGGRLTENDVEDIRKYILTKARERKQPAEDDTRFKKQEKQ